MKIRRDSHASLAYIRSGPADKAHMEQVKLAISATCLLLCCLFMCMDLQLAVIEHVMLFQKGCNSPWHVLSTPGHRLDRDGMLHDARHALCGGGDANVNGQHIIPHRWPVIKLNGLCLQKQACIVIGRG